MKAPNKRKLLLEWMENEQIFSTHEVIKFGYQHFFVSALRRVQEMAKEKATEEAKKNRVVRRLTSDEKALSGYKCKDDVYKWIGEGSALNETSLLVFAGGEYGEL